MNVCGVSPPFGQAKACCAALKLALAGAQVTVRTATINAEKKKADDENREFMFVAYVELRKEFDALLATLQSSSPADLGDTNPAFI